VLVVGYGNPARQDDGIGPWIADRIEEAGIDGVVVDADYQLTVEHAADVAGSRAVVFVDAAVEGGEPFGFRRVEPELRESFSTHSVSPGMVVGLAEELFGSEAKGYVLSVRGYSFAMFTEGMTEGARRNAEVAAVFLRGVLETGDFEGSLRGQPER